MKLIIITPVKNEAKTLRKLFESVLKQTIQPILWLIVDDYSEDKSGVIINEYVARFSFIKKIQPNIFVGKRSTGGHVVELINVGLNYIEENKIYWDILLKLDADIEICEDDYFAKILEEFEKNKKLGICSGYVFHYEKNKKIYDSKYAWHTQGQTKFYRKECFVAIGGLKTMKGWDGIDDVFARHLGFETYKILGCEVKHNYKTQTRKEEGGILAGIKREALGYRNRAYPIIFYFLKSLKIMGENPPLIKGIFFLFYSIYLNIFFSSPLTKQEKKIVKKFLYKRLMSKL